MNAMGSTAGMAPFAVVFSLVCFAFPANSVAAAPKPESYWPVDDIRAGMKGHGLTVLKGTKIESFRAEVLGVLKNTSPGRDLVLCRLSGLNLEKTGVIAGMSGSPIYIEGRLLGAVAYAWPFGKEPIAGVTPFCQMLAYASSFEQRDLAEQAKPRRVGMHVPFSVGDKAFNTVTVSAVFDVPKPAPEDGLWMVPLRTPLVATGFTSYSLSLLRNRCRGWDLVPVQGGAATTRVLDEEKDTLLQPGSPLVVALVRGDFDLAGIGTVTDVRGSRVYGWGHSLLGLGACTFPLMTGYIHAVYPRQSVSFKIGSPLKTVGVMNADVSTGIAGRLGGRVDMLPVHITVIRENSSTKTFKVEVVRQNSLLAPLVYSVLTNSVDMEGDLPEELTAEFSARLEVEGQRPVVIQDTFSGAGISAGRAPQALYNQVAGIVNLLTYNSYKPVRIKRIDCKTRILSGRKTAEIEALELNSQTFSPGEALKATVFIRPYKGLRQRLSVALELPADLPEGTYTALVCDDLTNARRQLQDDPNLDNPQNLAQIFKALKVQTSAKRTNLVLRVPTNAVGVALDGKSLPNLPPSMVQIIGNSRRTGAQTMGGALVSRRSTAWVIQGYESVRFTVTKNKKVLPPW